MKAEGLVAGFLIFHENRDFCDVCLATKLGLTRGVVRAAIGVLRASSTTVLRDRWVCQLCGTQGEVTRALSNRTVATKSNLRRRALRSA